jgi:hypothetical protein
MTKEEREVVQELWSCSELSFDMDRTEISEALARASQKKPKKKERKPLS